MLVFDNVMVNAQTCTPGQPIDELIAENRPAPLMPVLPWALHDVFHAGT